MSTTVDDVLPALEWRLTRLEYVLTGTNADESVTSDDAGASSQLSIPDRLATLDKRLSTLTRESPVISELLQLRASLPSSIHNGTVPSSEADLLESNKVSIVLATASTFYSAQSILSNLEGIKLEDASMLVPLVAMQESLAMAQARQRAQENEIGELRERTARLLARWHQDLVLTSGEQLADWEERLLDVERVIRRREVAQARDDML